MRIRGTLTGIVVVALLVAGCSSSGGEASSAADAPATGRLDSGEAAYDASGGGYEEAPAPSDGGVVGEPQYVITEGSMTVVVDEPTELVSRVSQIVTTAGGYVESRSEQAPTDDRAGRAWLVLRIPSAELDATLVAVEELGRLSTRETGSTDVSLTVTDLDARIEALEVSIDRLLTMLAEAQRTEDLISLERTLQDRQGELNSLRSQRTVLGNRVALATIELTLTSEPPPVTVGPGGFWPGLVSGWNALVDTLRGASVVIGMLLPWAVFFGVVTYVVVRLVRVWRRRRPARPTAPVVPAPFAAPGPYAHPYEVPAAPQPPPAAQQPAPVAPPTPTEPAPATEFTSPAKPASKRTAAQRPDAPKAPQKDEDPAG